MMVPAPSWSPFEWRMVTRSPSNERTMSDTSRAVISDRRMRETMQGQQRPVAHILQGVALDLVQHGPDHVAVGGCLAARRLAPFAARSSQDVEDHRAAANLVRDGLSGLPMGVADGGHPQR